jgi:hypothetical protein
MKRYVKGLLAVGSTIAITATTAFGQNNIFISVDEWGVGYANGAIMPSQIATEPISGWATVAYSLPFPGVPGDVALIEPDGTDSDLIRFDGLGHLFFFSDFDPNDPPDSPADVGIPPYNLPGVQTVILNEVGPEAGPNGYWGYAPGFTGPGGNTTGLPIYDFISDVPEPGALPLLACGLGILGYVQRRRKLARA